MDIKMKMRDAWQRLAGVEAAAGDATQGERKTAMLPSILSPYNPAGRAGQSALPKPTPANLRKFAETPVVRRAINVVKDRIASMDWQMRVRRGYGDVRCRGCERADGDTAAMPGGAECGGQLSCAVGAGAGGSAGGRIWRGGDGGDG